MSLSIQSSLNAAPKISSEYEPVSAAKVTAQAPKTANSTTKTAVPVIKPEPKLDESAQIKQLAKEGHSNQQIAISIGLPEDVVALTLGDSTTATATTSSASALVALNGRLSIYG